LPTEAARRGRLIALEGSRGPDLSATAKRLLRHLCRKSEGGVSEWDASNIFSELRMGDANIPGPSPRTLVLLYATDLAFRLRWEIKPALEEGQCVIAAPYVHSAIAFGKAAGLPRRWLVEVFRFVPKPEVFYRVPERRAPAAATAKVLDGYLEFCSVALSGASPPWSPVDLRKSFVAYLDALEHRRGCQAVTEELLASAGSGR
jgi:hypothetical protein